MSKNLIQSNTNLKDVIKRLQNVKIKTLIVLNKKKFVGTITDGDLRRALLNNVKFSSTAKDIEIRNQFLLKMKFIQRGLRKYL